MNRGKQRCAARWYYLTSIKVLDHSGLPTRCMGLSFRAVVSTPRRNDKPDTLRCQPSLGLSFLCSERTTALQDPSLRCGEKPIPLRYSTPTVFCLTHSLDSLSWPFLRVVMATIYM